VVFVFSFSAGSALTLIATPLCSSPEEGGEPEGESRDFEGRELASDGGATGEGVSRSDGGVNIGTSKLHAAAEGRAGFEEVGLIRVSDFEAPAEGACFLRGA